MVGSGSGRTRAHLMRRREKSLRDGDVVSGSQRYGSSGATTVVERALIGIGVVAILFNGSILFVLLTSGAPQTWTSSPPRPVTVASGAFPSAESRPAPVVGVAAATFQAGAVS